MKPIPIKKYALMPPSKPVGGFDLILGAAYNDGWFNELPPLLTAHANCAKCRAPVTVHKLQKVILAFGNLITKYQTIWTCPRCLHEELIHHFEPPPLKATKKNFVKIFSKLPKETQILLLGGKK